MNSNKCRSILVIDSGMGGLSICQSILAKQDNLQVIYFADDAYFPYGLMDATLLSERLRIIVSGMLKLHLPDLVVLACNTVSTLVLPDLRATFQIPFVGVVPAIKPAAIRSKTNKIGLLATPATIKRSYTDQLIKDHANGCEVVRLGSNELVLEAEKLISGGRVSSEVIEKVVSVFKTSGSEERIDTIVLGCTHFPFLKSALSKALPGVFWVDSGEAIAKRVKGMLPTFKGQEGVLVNAQHQIYFSKSRPDENVFSKILSEIGIDDYQIKGFKP